MKRRITIGVLAMLLAILAGRTSTASRLLDGARDFGRQFHSLKAAHSVNPIERIVLSLMLAS